MNKRRMEWIMGMAVLLGVWMLSREAALHTFSEKAQGPKVVIDAGHGGVDPGMVGVDGLEEKGLNLDIAKKLQKELEKAGCRAVLTRAEDRGLYEEDASNKKAQDMRGRCQFIAREEPALAVSIHQNSYSDPSVRGPQVFYYETSKEGEALAGILQRSLNQDLEVARPRSPKANASYYLLKHSEGVVNIVECGFLTNPEEARLLAREDYQEKVAQALARGILTYLEEKEEAPGQEKAHHV